MTTPTNLQQAQHAAETALAAYESLDLGTETAAERMAAFSAIEHLQSLAHDGLRVGFFPAGSDLHADWTAATQFFKKSTFAAQVAGLVLTCRESHPSLARFAFSGYAVEQVHYFAEQPDAIERYLEAISGSVAGCAEFEPFASVAAQTVPALRDRHDAITDRHKAHVAAERARIEAEAAARAEAERAAERSLRRELAEFFEGRSSMPHISSGRVYRGSALQAAALGQAAYDSDGVLGTPSLADLLRLFEGLGGARAVHQ